MAEKIRIQAGSTAAEKRGMTVIRSIEIPGPQLSKVGYAERKAAAERARVRHAERSA
jgi:hypothetical protein